MNRFFLLCTICMVYSTYLFSIDVNKYVEVTAEYIRNNGFDESPVVYETNVLNPAVGVGTELSSKVTVYAVAGWNLVEYDGEYPRFATANYGVKFDVIPDLLNQVVFYEDVNRKGAYLAMSGAWGSTVKLGQQVNLKKGSYFLIYDAYNVGTENGFKQNYFGFEPLDGAGEYSFRTTYPAYTWITDTCFFNIKENGHGNIVIGIVGLIKGSDNNVKLGIDNVRLYYSEEFQELPERPTAMQNLHADYPKVYVENRNIHVLGTENFEVYSLLGCKIDKKGPLPQGTYVVVVNGCSYKVLVK